MPTIGEVSAFGLWVGSSAAVGAAAGAAPATAGAAATGAGAIATGAAWICRATRTFRLSSSPYSRITSNSVRSFSRSNSAKALIKPTSPSCVFLLMDPSQIIRPPLAEPFAYVCALNCRKIRSSICHLGQSGKHQMVKKLCFFCNECAFLSLSVFASSVIG